MIRPVAPGSPLREGLDSILRARTGGLIVLGDSPEVMALVDGGFHVDTALVPAFLYELAKMDGAIILSRDGRRILRANAQLVPSPSIPTFETGTRHRTAERAAKQTGELLISISQRRNVITLYRGPLKYVLQDASAILVKANQAISTLERYTTMYRQILADLFALEFEGEVTAGDVAEAVQRGAVVDRIVRDIGHYIVELGDQGRLVSMQLQEIEGEVSGEMHLLLRDYLPSAEAARAVEFRTELSRWDTDSLLDLTAVARALGVAGSLDELMQSRGYRVMKRVPRLPLPVQENIVRRFGTLTEVMRASFQELDEVEGIGEVRARSVLEGLRRLRQQVLYERHL